VDLKELDLLGGDQDTHWYYVSKWRALRQALGGRPPERVLDIGAGSGFFSRMLLRDTPVASAVCVDPGYARDWSEVHFAKTIDFRRESSGQDADLVLMMDVLEHVDDDVALLRQSAAPASPGTRFVISVPAFQWLWSPHDEFLGHRRRYTLPELERTFTTSDLSIVDGFYMFATVFPAVVAGRLWRRWWSSGRPPSSDLRRHHPWTNALLTGICGMEAAVARHNQLVGLTVFGVAEKK
jgi:hypothetical protein